MHRAFDAFAAVIVFAAWFSLFAALLLTVAGIFFAKLRRPAHMGSVIAAWSWSLSLWCFAALMLLSKFALWVFIVGVAMLGAGVVPVAVLASLVSRHWADLGSLLAIALVIFTLAWYSGWYRERYL